jgi:hypothetical protein
MIFYGTNSMHISNDVMRTECPNCGATDCINISFHQWYAHIYWIPFFPTSKEGTMRCAKCGGGHLTKNVADEYNMLLAKQKTPIASFAGLGIVALIAVVAYVTSVWDDNQDAKSVQKPQKGDVYSVKIKEGGYTLYRVINAPKDSIWFQINEYQADKETAIDQLNSKPYGQDTFIMANSNLKSLYDKGEIIEVER